MSEIPLAVEPKQAPQFDVHRCYQCAKCAAGCPVTFAMDYTPQQIVRLVQMGLRQRARQSVTIWLCAACGTCSARCPQQVQVAELMESLRRSSLREDEATAAPLPGAVHRLMAECINRRGRVNEAALMARLLLRRGRALPDLRLALRMLARGKIKLSADSVRGQEQIDRIFEDAAAREER